LVIASCGPDSNIKNDSRDKTRGQDSTVRVRAYLETYESGKHIFKQHCEYCHGTPQARDVQIFDHVFDRMPQPSEDFFARFVQDSKKLKLVGDKYALSLDSKFDSNYEHNFKDSLTRNDIKDLILYIKVEVN